MTNSTIKSATNKHYAIVTFGTSPKKTVFRSLTAAQEAAQEAVGIGSCTTARVYECDTAELARTADISVIRKGERTI